MYPDKVKRVVVDGVYDAENYRATLWNTNLVDADAAYQSLFDYCHRAGPEKCAIYEPEPSKIRQRYFQVLDNVKRDPVAVPLAEPPIVITHKALLQQLYTWDEAGSLDAVLVQLVWMTTSRCQTKGLEPCVERLTLR